MAKNRKRKKTPAKQQLFQRAQRELSKGNAKAALKDAKLCYRSAPLPEHRRLLELAYVARVEQLQQLKLPAEAKTVLAELLKLVPTIPEVRDQIPQLQVVLGGTAVDSEAVFQKNPALLTELADQAVLDRRMPAPDHADVGRHVELVRAALAAIERGEDDSAAAGIRDIPRRSPLCDWKLFARGLSAFYQSDLTRTQANWGRLDPARPAFRIAQALLVASGELRRDDAPVDVSAALRKLEIRIQRDPAADLLKRLARHWQASDWLPFFRDLRQFRQRFIKTHKGLLDSLVDLVWKRAAREGDPHLLHRLVGIAPAPASDPHWHRAKAMLAEHPELTEADPVRQHWIAYAAELEGLPELPQEQRSIAAALVYVRLARNYERYARDFDRSNSFFEPDEEEARDFRNYAVRFYRSAIKRCPTLLAAYRELADLHEEMEDMQQAAMVLAELTQQAPEQYDAQLWLANYYLAQDQPDKSERYVEAAVRLKPRDTKTSTIRWNQRTTMIRCLVNQRMFEAARREWEEITRNVPAEVEPYVLDSLRAGIEWKAKNEDAAQQYLDAALAKVQEPTIIWMQMSCIAARYKLLRDLKKDFDTRFKKAIKSKPTSETAGRLAGMLAGYKVKQINYTGRATQERLVLAYLRRAQRIRWQEKDLSDVCEFLWQSPKQWELRDKMVDKAVKKFPKRAVFHFWAAQIEVESGYRSCDIDKAMRHLNRALELARQSNAPQDVLLVEPAEQTLAALHDFQEKERYGYGHAADDDWDSPYFDDDDDDDWDDDDDDGPVPDFMSPDGIDFAKLFAQMEREMPPEAIEELKQMAAAAGLDPVEMLSEVLRRKFGNEIDPAYPQAQPRDRRNKGRSHRARR